MISSCIMPKPHTGSGSSGLRRGMCGRHYQRWAYAGQPQVFLGVTIPEALRNTTVNLPNPWIRVTPPCPHCGVSEWVFLWADEGTLRWFCQPCRKRFDDVATESAA